MIRSKLLALCVCPAVAAPPAILAVHAPARHAVAHLLHHAANRLDGPHRASAPAPVVAAALPLPCAPSLAAEGGGLPVVGGGLIGGGDLPSPAMANGGGVTFTTAGITAGIGGGFAGGGGGGGGAGGGGSGGSGGGGGTPSGPGINPGGAIGETAMVPLIGPTGPSVPIATGSPIAISGAPEPATWVFLVTGFGLVGAIARRATRSRPAAEPARPSAGR